MSGRDTAERQLERILYLLPLAAREGGAELEALARELGVSRERVVADLEEVIGREYYHLAGGADDLLVYLQADLVEVRPGREFARPPRLGLGEALALHLALHLVAAERSGAARERLLSFARRLGPELATRPAEAFLPGYRLDDGAAADEIRALLFRAARERRRVRLRYLKADAPEPEERVVEPWRLAHATGRWYALGRSVERDDVRAFRLDRIVEIEALEETFTVPDDFEPEKHLDGARVFRTDDPAAVTVRYSPRIARWMAERGWGEPAQDGSLTAEHPVADPDWAVRHALRYGPDAEVLAPEEIRALVRETAETIAAAHG